jgi:hypothetical protein
MDLAASSVTPELNHKLLQLLASLAGQPLDSTLEQTPQLLQLLYKPAEEQQAKQPQQVSAVSRFRQLLRGGRAAAADGVSEDAASTGCSSDDEYDPYAEESDLTSWESDDEQQQQQQQLKLAEVAQQDTDDDSTEAVLQLQVDASSTAPQLAVYRPADALQAPHQLQPGRCSFGRHQLLGKLVGARPAQLPDRAACFSEQYLAQQLLRVLQGQQAHGFLLQAEQQAGAGPLAPDPRVTTPVLSPGALHALLQEFAEAGSAARQLRRLAAQLTQSRGRGWLLSSAAAAPQAAASGGMEFGIAGVPATTCLRAFGVALHQQLDLMGQQLAELQGTGLAAAAAAGAVQQPRLTLLMVKQRTRPIVRRLQLLHNTVSAVLQQLGGCPADASATLLDGLQEAASAAALTASGQQGVADAAALLHLLLCSCVPLVAALSQWLWTAADGAALDDEQLPALPPAAAAASRQSSADAAAAQQQQQQLQGASCCCEDFFIVKRAAVAATDARFWHAAYGFSQRRAACSSSGGSGGTADGTAAAGVVGVCAEPGGTSMVACPAFLMPLAASIMTAGKGMRLLDYMEQEELRRTSFCSSSKGSSSGVVHAASGAWLGAAAATSSKPARQLARSSSSSTGAAPQQLGRVAGVNSSSAGRQPLGKARSSSMGGSRAVGPAADVAAGTAGAGASRGRQHRRQWSSAGAAAAPAAAGQQPGVAVSNLTKQVRLQLAVAAAVAGRSEQEQLPQQFIAAASQLLQGQQPAAHPAVAGAPLGKQAAGTAVSAGELMWQVLQAAGQQLSQPCPHPGNTSLQQQRQHAGVSLRDALLAAKAQRAALASPAKGSTATVSTQQQGQAADQHKATVQQETVQQEPTPQQQHMPAEAGGDHTEAAVVEPSGGALAADSSNGASAVQSAPDVPRLLQWRDQLEARLAVAGSCLQQMAPWQQQQQQQEHSKPNKADSTNVSDAVQQAACDASGAGCGPLLLPAAGRHMPGSFSASLAGLWPLQQPLRAHRSAAAAIKQWGAAGWSSSSTDEQRQQQQRLAWLTGSCPGEELGWLLLDPPRSLPPLPQLLDQALLGPIQERVRRLMLWSSILASCANATVLACCICSKYRVCEGAYRVIVKKRFSCLRLPTQLTLLARCSWSLLAASCCSA